MAGGDPQMAEATGTPTAVLETVDDRIRRLEAALDRMSGRPDPGPPGFMSTSLLPALLPAAPVVTAAGLWGRVPLLRELRLMLGMYFDPRYRISRPGQFAIPAVLGLILLNYLFFNWFIAIPLLPIVGVVLERLVLVVLAVALYKLLAREAGRYEAVLRYLAQYAR